MYRWLKVLFLVILISILFLLLRIMLTVPFLRDVIKRKFCKLSTLREADFEGCIFNWAMFKAVVKQIKMDIFKSAAVGKFAPDTDLCKMQSETGQASNLSLGKVILSNLSRPGIPLVLNFGSCSCPPFMAKWKDFNNVAEKHSRIADFALIYIEEAHPSGGWAFKVSNCFREFCTRSLLAHIA